MTDAAKPGSGDGVFKGSAPSPLDSKASGMSVSSDSRALREPSAAERRRFYRRTLPRTAAFWLLAATFCLLFVAAAAPAPLYRVYQAEWRFSVTTLTAVFAVYALVLLVTLLMFGSVSDYFGRRSTIAVGLVAYGMACGVFLAAGGVAALFVARALQGVAVGLATGALGAAMIELQPQGSGLAAPVSTAANPLGLALGGFLTSLLVQYGPARTHLVWWLLLAADLAALVAVLAIPESRAAPSPTRPSFRPRLRVPLEARGAFAAALPCVIGVWALGGFYLSLGPSLAAQLLRSQNLLWGGFVIALLFGVGVPITLVVRNHTPSKIMLGGCEALFAGALITFAAIATRTPTLLLAGSAVAGLGWGPAFLGAYDTIVTLARPEERAGLVAAIFTVGFLALSIPAVIAGIATSHYGLHKTALVYTAVVAVLAATAAGTFLIRRARRLSTRRRKRWHELVTSFTPENETLQPQTERHIMIIFDNPATVPAPAAQYSHVARVEIGGKTILQLSGQVAIDADRNVVGEDMTTQADFIMDNITAILAAHGATLADVVNLRTYVTDMSQLPDYGKVRAARFTATPPTITTIEVSRLWVPGALLEVEALAIT